MLSTQKEVTCPYCQLTQKVRVEINDSSALLRGVERFDVIHCDVETGGCDQPFVVQTMTRIEVTAEAHSIGNYNKLNVPDSLAIVKEQP